jgi:hypothetical protein
LPRKNDGKSWNFMFFYRILPLKTMENGDECDDQLEN